MSGNSEMRRGSVRPLFIAWTAFQRRQTSMIPMGGFEVRFMPVPRHARRLRKLVFYLVHAAATWRLMCSSRPPEVWVQLPQVPLLWVALLYRLWARNGVKVVADCHNAMLRPPWSRFPLLSLTLRAADVVLVHNEAMRAEALAQGWPAEALRVLEDVPPVCIAATGYGTAQSYVQLPRPWVVVPGSFSPDEPIREVLEAARRAPEIGFVLTGSLKAARSNHHPVDDLPVNVVLPDFMPTEAFDALLGDADVVMGLTRFADTQLSVCNEALGFGKPLVTSNTRLLRELFGAAAVFVDTEDPASIAEGCRQALQEAGMRAAASQRLANERLRRWQREQWADVQALLRQFKRR
ncbi:glycosyltransferase [Mycolicibacterium austroafricanum]|uniref:glycosyltransferase n=1 Tax=Mycolicibacterium austroafricanum TaxID=39687 RepID=UPI001CA3060B|nr:glycosyltransferase [Mycolicibacterium austroafricanum]QZT63653.1 hypothetical protein JN085_04485 [Mycolicibacterium austroafricanum]